MLVLPLLSCAGHAPPPLAAGPIATLADTRADQVVSQGDITYALGHDLTILRGDVVITRVPADCPAPCPATLWTSAASIPALDGDGQWIVATRFDGTLWRVRIDGTLEPIGARFGLADEAVRAVAGAGTTIAVLLDRAVLVTTDGIHVTRYVLATPRDRLAVARDRVALAGARGVEVWDLAANQRSTFAVAGARPGFLDADAKGARLVVVSPRGVWLERAGELQPLAVANVGAIAIAGAKLWLEVGKRLYLAGEQRGVVGTTVATAAGEPMFGTPNGDVWVGASGLRRYSLDARGRDPAWDARVQPIFARVCAHCHLPGGDAGVDLSTPASWAGEHDELVRRVLVTRTMPPAGTVLDGADRSALAAYLHAPP
ncbi:MAG: cytochrome c [Kofleriaceae bacterium]